MIKTLKTLFGDTFSLFLMLAVFALLVAVLLFSGCNLSPQSASEDANGAPTAGTTGAPKPAPTPAGFVGKTASVSGSVSAFSAAADGGALSFASVSTTRAAALDAFPANLCATGQFVVAYVGGGGTTVASGSVTDGAFNIDGVPLKQELVITFQCQSGESLRCLGKAGDQGLICDAVADAVLMAFENTIGSTITAPIFNGKPISKVAASIVEAAQNDTSAAETFKAAIENCRQNAAAPASCYRTVISSSPFAGPFQLMESLAQGWSVEAIFNLAADVLGQSIDVDSFIYTDFATRLDQWLGTDFVAKVRKLVSDIVTDQIQGNGDKFVIKLECELHYSKYHAGGSLKFSPVLVAVGGITQPSCKNDAALTQNGFTLAQRNLIYEVLDNEEQDPRARNGIKLGTVGLEF